MRGVYWNHKVLCIQQQQTTLRLRMCNSFRFLNLLRQIILKMCFGVISKMCSKNESFGVDKNIKDHWDFFDIKTSCFFSKIYSKTMQMQMFLLEMKCGILTNTPI